MTSTTPLSGTLVTTYTFDAANHLTDRAVSDGRFYTYDWSDRGQLLAEWTQGYPVRTFTYDGAGRLVEATVFTLTTRFTYKGLGARVAVEVVGHGTTTYSLDYAGGNRILAEETITGATLYLHGRDCLGQFEDDGWLYYLSDAEGLVRQGADEEGQVVSGWLFDPDGTVLEGPQGPVSHLVCGGVYDWSTGLIYKDQNYFDPMLGIWLALVPLVVVQSWRGRKKKRRGFPWYSLLLLGVCVGGLLTACGGDGTPPLPTPCTDALPRFVSLEPRFLSGPNVVPVPDDEARRLGFEPPAQVLRLAQDWTSDGVQFIGVVDVPAGVEGDLYMIQNVCPNDRRWRVDGSEEVYGDGQTWYLDSSIPYDDIDEVPHITGPDHNVVHDTNYDALHRTVIGEPGVEDLAKMQVDTQYKMYMMWERQGWRRTLGMVKWGWRATAERLVQQDRIPRAKDPWIVTMQDTYSDPGVAVSPDFRPISAPNVVDLHWTSGSP